VRILFVNHTTSWSGAEVALMRLLKGLRAGHEIIVACPATGPLAGALDAAGISRVRVPASDLSLRPHPVRTPRGLAQTALAGVAIRHHAQRRRADVIHANTLRAALMCGVAARLGAPPVVAQVHEHLPMSALGRATRMWVARTAAGVVAVTDRTAAEFNRGLPAPIARRVYVSVDLDEFDPDRVDAAPLRHELGLPDDALLMGQIAQITPWKGQDTAVRMLAGVAAVRPDVHLVIVGTIAFRGTTRYDNDAFLASLHELVERLGLRDRVHFLGQRKDVPALLRAFALTVLPSSDEPFGLAALESMAMRTPPLVTAVGGASEYIEDGVSGRLLPPGRPEAWIEAALALLDDPERRRRMADVGRRVALRFSGERYAAEMLDAYRRVACAAAPPGAKAIHLQSRAQDERGS
jgi:glycosyltransferase involved in cell wall biosynthesis